MMHVSMPNRASLATRIFRSQAGVWDGEELRWNVGTSLVLNVEVKLGLPVLLKTHRIDTNSVSHTPIRIACKIQSVLPCASMSCFVFPIVHSITVKNWHKKSYRNR